MTGVSETEQGVDKTLGHEYDLLGQLTEARVDGAVTSAYTYDANGNRLTSLDTSTATYGPDDALLTYGDRTYAYSGGQLATMITGGITTTYDYGMSGELRSVDDGTTRIEYVHDALNRRVGKRINGALVTGWLYQDALNPVAELNPDGTVRARFVYGTMPHVPDLMLRDGRTYAYITDQLGSVRLVVDTATGAVVQRLEYDDFGNVLSDSAPGFQPFAFAGGLYDTNTGLVRFGARDYDAQVGRWTARDPVGFAGGQTNLFAYSHSSPQSFVDPDGHAVWAAIFIAALITGVANALPHKGKGTDVELRAFKNGAKPGGAAAGVVGTGAGLLAVGTTLSGALATGASGAITKTLNLDHCVEPVRRGYYEDIAYATGVSTASGAVAGAFAPVFPGMSRPLSGNIDKLTPLGIGLAESASSAAVLLYNGYSGLYEGM